MENGASGKHPLFDAGLPDWLADVPIYAPKPTNVTFAEGKVVPSNILISALTGEVGAAHGSLAIAPELAQLFSQFTEKPAWMNLPAEPTWVTRVSEDAFEVSVGDFKGTFNRAEIEKRLTETLRRDSEAQAPNE